MQATKLKETKSGDSLGEPSKLQATKATVLIADDDPITRKLLVRHLESAGHEVVIATDGAEALDTMSDRIEVALLDLRMPKVTGLECLQRFRKEYPDAQVIMVTSSDDVADAVEAMKHGASDYVKKPFEPNELLALVDIAAKSSKLSRDHRGLKAVVGSSLPTQEFTVNSPGMKRLMELVGRTAELDSTVLLTGESGTGKTTVARLIHQLGPRANEPFVAVNCASLPRDLIEAELFGHTKGAFTGASGDRPGRVEIANGGTLFLDEIGDLPLELQPKLLTFLQDRTIQRIGSNKDINVDVRLIAATHQDLSEMCDEKRFRQDLFYRLNVLSLEVPPVRQRIDDIPGLVHSILSRISERRGETTPSPNEEAMRALQGYAWPGNIREMENVLESATAFCDGTEIRVADLNISSLVEANGKSNGETATGSTRLAGLTLAELERLAIIETLEACDGNKAMTARTLGISEKSIYNKMRRHGIGK